MRGRMSAAEGVLVDLKLSGLAQLKAALVRKHYSDARAGAGLEFVTDIDRLADFCRDGFPGADDLHVSRNRTDRTGGSLSSCGVRAEDQGDKDRDRNGGDP